MFKQAQDKLLSDLPNIKSSGKNLLAKAKGDNVLWGIAIVLACFSILVVYSATGNLAYKKYEGNTEFFLRKQVLFISVGLVVMYLIHQVNYNVFSKISTWLFYLSIPLLIYTYFKGSNINDGSRWIKIPFLPLTLQTSDLAKLALYMHLSKIISKKQAVIKDFKQGFLPCFIPVGIICVLIMPTNLSNALLTGATSLLLMFIGRVNIKHILMVIAIAVIGVCGLVFLASQKHKGEINAKDKNAFVESISQYARMGTWIHRVEDFIYPTNNGQNITQRDQANIAIANGGIISGLGPGNSYARNFLPQAYNDFIFAIIIEEYGLLGAAIIIFLYIVFLFRSIRIFKRCPYAFGSFLTIGLSFTLVIQALANMAVSVGLVPVTGVTLPLVSLGGTSFIFTCASIGIILSVGRSVEQLYETPSATTISANNNLTENE